MPLDEVGPYLLCNCSHSEQITFSLLTMVNFERALLFSGLSYRRSLHLYGTLNISFRAKVKWTSVVGWFLSSNDGRNVDGHVWPLSDHSTYFEATTFGWIELSKQFTSLWKIETLLRSQTDTHFGSRTTQFLSILSFPVWCPNRTQLHIMESVPNDQNMMIIKLTGNYTNRSYLCRQGC